MLAAPNVERPVDDYVEGEARSRPELEHPHAALDAVAERDEADARDLLEPAGAAPNVFARVAASVEVRHRRRGGRAGAWRDARRRTSSSRRRRRAFGRDEGGIRAAEEDDCAGDVLGLGEAAGGCVVDDLALDERRRPRLLAPTIGVRTGPGMSGVDADAAARPLDAEYTREPDDARFARAVRRRDLACRPRGR